MFHLHQFWIGPNPPLKFMHDWEKECGKRTGQWKYHRWTFWKTNPQQTIVYLRDQNQESMILRCSRQYLGLPEDNFCGRADIARYEILHQFGGIYLDADSIMVKFFPENLYPGVRYDFWTVYHNERNSGRIANGTICCQPCHPIMQKCIDAIAKISTSDIRKIKKEYSWSHLGPNLFTTHVNEFQKRSPYTKMSILPNFMFYAKHFRRSKDKPLTEQDKSKIIAVHAWYSTHHGDIPSRFESFAQELRAKYV